MTYKALTIWLIVTKTRIKGFRAAGKTASGQIVRPNPRRIKEKCCWQRQVAVGHTRYATNNPYKFIDPDGRTELSPFMERNFPKGDIFRAAGEAMGALAAFGVGVATNDQVLQNTAIEGMRENVSAQDGISAAMMGAGTRGGGGRTATTYTRVNTEGVVYSGRTGGKGTPEQQVAARLNSPDHKAKTEAGYGPGIVDKNSANAGAIRGREQQLIDQNGGAQSQGGTSGNKINGVSPTNPKAGAYQKACKQEFGC